MGATRKLFEKLIIVIGILLWMRLDLLDLKTKQHKVVCLSSSVVFHFFN